MDDKRILRIEKRHWPFLLMDKRIVEDHNLSYKAKGLMAYLMSKPDDWHVILEDLINQSTDGRNSVQSALRELRDAGYAKLRNLTNNGQLAGKVWVLSEDKFGSITADRPETGLSDRQAGFPTVGKSTTTNNELFNNVLTKKERTLLKSKKPTLQEVKKRSAELGLPELEAEKFFNYYESVGWHVGRKAMTSWRAALAGWKLRASSYRNGNQVNGDMEPSRIINGTKYTLTHGPNINHPDFNAWRFWTTKVK